jgi:hypothetical protein
MYQMAVIYIPNGQIIHQPFLFQGPPKFAKIGISGLKIGIPCGNPAVVRSSDVAVTADIKLRSKS